MIDVYVANYNGRSLSPTLVASFDSGGGTIGRVADNHFVLPDPARHVSRRHARIRCEAGRFFIANISDANPLFLNEAEIKAGEEYPLAPGDEVRIGLYLLGVRSTPAQSVVPSAPVYPRSEPNSGPGAVAFGSSLIGSVDPINALSGGSGAPDPFADLMGSALPSSAAGGAVPKGSPTAEQPRAIEASGVPQSLGPALPQAPREAAPVSPSGTDPFADLLGSNTLWAQAAAGAGSINHESLDAARGSALDLPLSTGHDLQARLPNGRASSLVNPHNSPAPVPIDPNAASVPALDALLAAFLKGAGVPNTSIRNGLTPELMESLGSLVRNATAGAMELIAARQITKREVRAEVTMLVPKGNNPLKFLPTPEAAIMQMLDPRIPGFTSTADAMLEVFDDLRGHQVGIIAGIRAALADVLLRFDPAVLERRLGESGLLASLVPASRQAKLWQLYETQFQQIAREAEDNYHALFGDAFAKAYAEQVPQKHGKRGAS